MCVSKITLKMAQGDFIKLGRLIKSAQRNTFLKGQGQHAGGQHAGLCILFASFLLITLVRGRSLALRLMNQVGVASCTLCSNISLSVTLSEVSWNTKGRKVYSSFKTL